MATQAENRARWVEIVGRFRRSGLTKAAFAQREQLRLTDLKNWHYRLPREKTATTAKRPPVRLIPVNLSKSLREVTRPAPQVVVDIQALQVAVGAGADPAAVAELVAAIRKRTC